MNNKKLKTIIAAIFLIFSAINIVNAEDFKGEKELINKLSPFERNIYYGLQYLLNKYQKKEFLSIKDPMERAVWRKKFWMYNDPTPTTRKNERKIEHELRVSLAKKLFGMEKPPGWDKRGETLIRFGLPSSRAKVPANIGFYRMTPPGEIWYYKSLDMLIPFQNFNLNGIFIYAIESYGETGRQTVDRLQNLKQYYTNINITDLIYSNPDDVRNIASFNPDEIDYISDPDIRAHHVTDLIAAIENEKIIRSKFNFYKYLKEHPTIYSFEVNKKPLPVYFDIVNYRKSENLVQTKVSFEIPSNEIRFIKKEGKLKGKVMLSAVARNMNMDEVASGNDSIIVIQSGSEKLLGNRHLPGVIAFDLTPGYYRIGIEAVDSASEHRGVYNTSVQIDSMDNRLAMSDIQLSSMIREVNKKTKFNRGNFQIIPHPLHAYRIPYPLTFYFEIYGLGTNNDDIAFYSIEYKITPLGKRRKGPVYEDILTAISSKFEREGKGADQIQRLQIATDNLWKGTFKLTVSVIDRTTRERIQKSANFSILEQSE